MKNRTPVLVAIALFAIIASSCTKECDCNCPQEKTLTTQPGPNDGQDCIVSYRTLDPQFASTNQNVNPDFGAWYWTFNAEGDGEGPGRAYVKFPQLSEIPQTATIKSAKLSLYGVSVGGAMPQGNSYYPGSGYNAYGDNKGWLKRVLANWDETTITWNNMPATTDAGEVEVAASTSQWNYSVTDLDVTQLVKEMVANNQNYGFSFQMQVEQIYRSMVFGTSENADATKRPKLVVVYTE
jgi:hypothetical protein